LLALVGLTVLAAGLFPLLQPVAYAAATFTVNSTGDGADSNTADDLCNDGTGNCTLRAAIQQANATAGADTIAFSVAGTVNLTGALPAIASDITINGPGSSLLNVRRDTGGDYRIFTVESGANVNITALRVSNGRTPGGSVGPSLDEVADNGGGILNKGSLALSSCVVSDNSVPSTTRGGYGGGGIGNWPGATLTITNSTVSGNSAGIGGGITSAGALTITDSSVTGNTAVVGGGIISNGGTLTVTGSTVSNNSVTFSGGGVFNNGATASITNSAVTSNTAAGDGGGVYNNATLNITNSTVSNNTARSGGGIDNFDGTLTVTNSTVSGNAADGSTPDSGIGGGIINSNHGTATLRNSTVTNNSANTFGGGLYNANWQTATALQFGNSIVAGNTAASAGPDLYEALTSQGHNLVGNVDGATLTTAAGDQIGSSASPINPRLGPLADNGGPTLTHALLTGSPALDAGDNALAVDSGNVVLTTDQRGAGFARFADAADAGTTQTVDIGAFEANPTIEEIADRTINEDIHLFFNFNVGDTALNALTVTATSSNTALVPNGAGRLNVTGSGALRQLDVLPTADASGVTTITVTAMTAGGRTATDSFVLTVAPVNNDPPTGISLSNSSVADNSPAGTIVGTLSTSDPDVVDNFTYTLSNFPGSLNNVSFVIDGDKLKTSGVFDFETQSAYTVRVRTTDSTGNLTEKQFNVNVTDGPDNPGAVSLSSSTYNVGEADGSATVTLKRTGGADNRAIARVGLADVTTSTADYVYRPGSIDSTFNPGGTGATSNSSALPQYVSSLAVQPDGKVIIGGAFLFYNGTARNRIARVNPDGSLDTTFNPGTGFNDYVSKMVLQPDGKVIVAGNFTGYNGVTRPRLARLHSDGSLDTSFPFNSSGPNGAIYSLALQPDGKVLVGGGFTAYNVFTPRKQILRLNADGTLDNTFVAAGSSTASPDGPAVSCIAVQPDGKIVIGGGFFDFGGVTNTRILRLNADGSVDASFTSATGLSLAPSDILLQPDGKLVVGGQWAGNDTPYGEKAIVRLNGDGSVDNTFNPGTGIPGFVNSLALQPDGKLIVAGNFPSYNGTTVGSLARVNPDGSLDTTFHTNPGANSPVWDVALLPDVKVLIGGQYNSYDGVTSNGLTRIRNDLFVTWAPGDSSDKTVSLPVVNDTTVESNETMTLSLSTFGGVAAGAPSSSTLTIADNDTVTSSVSGAGVYNATATLNATLTAGGSPLTGKTVAFTLNGVSVGTAATNASGVATLSNVSIAGVGAGTYAGAVGASFASDSAFTGSASSGALEVAKANQTITFGALTDRSFGDADFNVNATAGSDLGVSFAASGNCTVTGGTVHLNGAGACTVTASQAGDANYNAAADVSRSFQIAKAATAVALASSANPSAPGQSVTFTANVTSAAGAPTGSVQFKSGGANLGAPAALGAGGVATLTTSALSAGTHAVTAEYGGDANFAASSGALAGAQTVGGLFEFTHAHFAINERANFVAVTVRRRGDTTQAAAVEYATDDGSVPTVPVPCSSVTGIALERCDYTRAQGLLQFTPGEDEKSFAVLVNNDLYVEGAESTHVRLSNPTPGAVLGALSSAAIDIADDPPQVSNPLGSQGFVRQHYHDFLSREPDASGLDFWTQEIEQCGGDPACREIKRINISAAFFLSIEFQQTGYLVERMYKAAYGDATGASTLGGAHQLAVPAVRLHEFLPDTQRLGRDVVVGRPNWEDLLEANKRDFALEFVGRARFASAFPSTMTAEEFVNRIDQNTGGVLTAADRAALVATLGASPGDAAKRAQVLRAAAENEALRRAEFNRAFVLMQYFGYLRRDPDAAPDADYTGYEFWLGKLNEFNGNYIQAEMVKAFIDSIEYRNRFGQ
jgi:uncharacterized delta-60 repeat protein/CSLREA domain-containing protein